MAKLKTPPARNTRKKVVATLPPPPPPLVPVKLIGDLIANHPTIKRLQEQFVNYGDKPVAMAQIDQKKALPLGTGVSAETRSDLLKHLETLNTRYGALTDSSVQLAAMLTALSGTDCSVTFSYISIEPSAVLDSLSKLTECISTLDAIISEQIARLRKFII
jgi:hypothetical protein